LAGWGLRLGTVAVVAVVVGLGHTEAALVVVVVVVGCVGVELGLVRSLGRDCISFSS
jgi:hypothetical protein